MELSRTHAAEGIADGVAVAGLEGLGDELGVGGRGTLLNFGEFGGDFKLSETLGHGGNDLNFKERRLDEATGRNRLEAGVVFDDELLVDRKAPSRRGWAGG